MKKKIIIRVLQILLLIGFISWEYVQYKDLETLKRMALQSEMYSRIDAEFTSIHAMYLKDHERRLKLIEKINNYE